ncbi:MAG: MAPEG family protein [Burkholderiaceae bacterium]|nr:MAPEG family protein [Burkholderiaceae bacterium]
MHWSFLCLLFSGLLPVVGAGIAKAGLRDFDNHAPREWLARQSGYRARANAAQANSFEAFPLFAAAVLLALQAGVAQSTLDTLAIAFVLARLAYIASYLADRATLRSLCWFIGHGCAVALFVLALQAA